MSSCRKTGMIFDQVNGYDEPLSYVGNEGAGALT